MDSVFALFAKGASNFLTIIFIIDVLFAFAIIFLERKEPSATLAWIMVLFFIPVGGLFLYLLLSQNISRRKMFKLTPKEEAKFSEALSAQIKEMDEGSYLFRQNQVGDWVKMIRLNQTYSQSFYTQNNNLTIYTDGEEKFNALLNDIKNAKSHIHIMYYIVRNDSLGRRLISLLCEKARQGVEVRLLMDAMGSRTITNFTLKELRQAGGQYAFFFPFHFKFMNFKVNYRNHRKLVVIDGNIGYIGGFNVGTEYLGRKKKFGYWRDTHLRLTGPCLYDLQTRFILDWRFAAKEELDLTYEYFQEKTPFGQTGIQIVSSGPDAHSEPIKHGYLKMISAAKKNIYIQTPYFIPDDSILESLKNAAFSGIDLKIMIPNKPDHIFVYWGTYAYIGELLKAGAKVYIYDNGFLHAKTICTDGLVASVGSANFDKRSFRLNFEANAFIYDENEVSHLENIFYEDIKKSTELTLETYQSRSLFIKFKESIARLISDIL